MMTHTHTHTLVLLLGSTQGGPNILSTQLNLEDTLHLGKDIGVWGATTTLIVIDDGGLFVDRSGQGLLGKTLFLTSLLDGQTDGLFNLFWSNNIVCSVHLGDELTISAVTRRVLASRVYWGEGRIKDVK